MAPQDSINGRYPEYLMPIAGTTARWETGTEVWAECYEKFCDLREMFLLDYCYNTARAYWSDLDDLWCWAVEHALDVTLLSSEDLLVYFDNLRDLGYRESTIRRRGSCFHRFYAVVVEGVFAAGRNRRS